MQLSEHFSLAEFTRSDYADRHAIDNRPTDPDVLANLRLCAQGLEGVRAILSVPVYVTSGYRCAALNSGIGGSAHSQHMIGQAVDFIAPQYGAPVQIARALAAYFANLAFDQLILEGRWVHISFAQQARGSILTAHFSAGQPATYTKGLV
jgi:hypothetical protein